MQLRLRLQKQPLLVQCVYLWTVLWWMWSTCKWRVHKHKVSTGLTSGNGTDCLSPKDSLETKVSRALMQTRITRALHSCGAVSPGKDASFMYIAEAFSASEESVTFAGLLPPSGSAAACARKCIPFLVPRDRE